MAPSSSGIRLSPFPKRADSRRGFPERRNIRTFDGDNSYANYATHANINNFEISKNFLKIFLQQPPKHSATSITNSGASVAGSIVSTLSGRSRYPHFLVEACQSVSFYAFFNR